MVTPDRDEMRVIYSRLAQANARIGIVSEMRQFQLANESGNTAQLGKRDQRTGRAWLRKRPEDSTN